MFLWRGGRPLYLSEGTTGDVVTSAVDDRNVDSRFCGNDEMRGVGFRGRAQGPAPTIAVGDRACPRLDRGALCLSGGTTGDVVTSAVDD